MQFQFILMVKIFDVHQTQLINKVAEELKKLKDLSPPDWAKFVKTGVHRERPPESLDWWYVRAAAVLRKVYKLGPIGVSKLRKAYGGKQRRGHKPPKTKLGSGNILRTILQQLEKAELVKQAKKSAHKGRIATAKGVSLLDKIARELFKNYNKENKTVAKADTNKVDTKHAEKAEEKVESKTAHEKKAVHDNKTTHEKTIVHERASAHEKASQANQKSE